MVLVIPQFDDHELQSLKKHSNFCTFVMYTYIYRWWRNEMTDRTKKKKWYGRVPGGMQTLARSWISRRFGPQARFWHPFDISFPESCFTIQSSSPQPNGARVKNFCWNLWGCKYLNGKLISREWVFSCQNGLGHNRYDDGSCVSESQCSLCNFKEPPRAALRGLCSNRWKLESRGKCRIRF